MPVDQATAVGNPRSAFQAHCDAIESCYEYMIGFAGRGINDEQTDSPLRRMLAGCESALRLLPVTSRAIVESEALTPRDVYENFLTTVQRDADAALTAVRLALGQRVISAQLIDNLNASIHVRAVLTDLFLLDEALKPAR